MSVDDGVDRGLEARHRRCRVRALGGERRIRVPVREAVLARDDCAGVALGIELGARPPHHAVGPRPCPQGLAVLAEDGRERLRVAPDHGVFRLCPMAAIIAPAGWNLRVQHVRGAERARGGSSAQGGMMRARLRPPAAAIPGRDDSW